MDDAKRSDPTPLPGWPRHVTDTMLTGFVDEVAPTQQTAMAPYCARRRATLCDKMRGTVLVIPAGREKVRSNDTFYEFRALSDFVYLTGCLDPEGVLIIDAGNAPAGADELVRATLYLPERRGPGTRAYYSDYQHGELWVGRRLSGGEASGKYGLSTAPLSELPRDVFDFADRDVAVLRGVDSSIDALFGEMGSPECDEELTEILGSLRLVKDEYEISALRASIASSVRGFEDVVRTLVRLPATSGYLLATERLVEGVFGLRARVEGNGVGYPTIAAAGSHATTLHWTKNNGALRPGDLLLLDAGVEGSDLYTADITRTLPVSGVFTDVQRRVYEIVLAAQRAAIATIGPGVLFKEPHLAAQKVLAQGLYDLGVLSDPPEVTLLPERQDFRRYTLHGTSHMLGLDVHDCASAREQEYFGELREGFVLTVEPGLYFQENDLTVIEELRGIGIRIEDDILVTANGCEVLTSALPTAPADIERRMAVLALS